MNFFYFGHSEEKLYGTYMPAVSASADNAAVLLCYPFGHDYMRSHKAFRQIATLLSRQGIPVMRFDYYATGDSAGSCEQADIEKCCANAVTAVDELKSLSGARQVYIVGLRLGAVMAAHAAKVCSDVTRLVLWEPIIDGAGYIQGIENSLDQKIDDTWWLNGFALSPSLRQSIRSSQLDVQDTRQGLDVLLLNAASEGDEAIKLSSRYDTVEVVPVAWDVIDSHGGALIPQDAISIIVNWFGAVSSEVAQ